MRSLLVSLCAALTLVMLSGCDAQLSRPSLYNQVEVTVTASGTPVPKAHLMLYTGARRMGYGDTGADGKYTFRRVPQNNYGVLLWPLPPGYDTVSRGAGRKPANVVDGLDVRGEVTVHIAFELVQR